MIRCAREECTVCRNFTHLTAYGQCRSECPAGAQLAGMWAKRDVTRILQDGPLRNRLGLQEVLPVTKIFGRPRRCMSPCNLCESATKCTECLGGSYLTPAGRPA